jgi:hypothetical protein
LKALALKQVRSAYAAGDYPTQYVHDKFCNGNSDEAEREQLQRMVKHLDGSHLVTVSKQTDMLPGTVSDWMK